MVPKGREDDNKTWFFLLFLFKFIIRERNKCRSENNENYQRTSKSLRV